MRRRTEFWWRISESVSFLKTFWAPILMLTICAGPASEWRCYSDDSRIGGGYGVDGTVTHRFYKGSGEVDHMSVMDFTVRVRGELWKIETRFREEYMMGIDRTVSFTDATNVYTIKHYAKNQILGDANDLIASGMGPLPPDPKELREVREDREEPINVAGAVIQSGVAPTENYYMIAPLWLCYASSSYLSSPERNGRAKPVWVVSDRSIGYREIEYPMLASMEKAQPMLPDSVAYFSDGIGRLGKKGSLDLHEFRLRSPYENGYTNAVYNVGGWTNVGPYKLPLSAELIQLCELKTAVSSNDLRRCHSWKIEGLSFKTELERGDDELRGVLPAKTFVKDRRNGIGIDHRVGVLYLTDADNKWRLDVTELQKSEEFARAKEIEGSRDENLATIKNRTLFVRVVLVGLAGFLVFGFWRQVRQK